jgi:hypothetical protein
MACCGGGRNVKIRSQPISVRSQAAPKIPKPLRVITQKHYIVPRAKCPQCGYPTMIVNIGGRERQQCSNTNCKTVLKWSHRTF